MFRFLLVIFSNIVHNISHFSHIKSSKVPWPWTPRYSSVKVIGNLTMWYSAYDFLFIFWSNYNSLSGIVSNIIQCRKMSRHSNCVKSHSTLL